MIKCGYFGNVCQNLNPYSSQSQELEISHDNLLQIKFWHIIFDANIYCLGGTKLVPDDIFARLQIQWSNWIIVFTAFMSRMHYESLTCHFQTSMSASAPGPKRLRVKYHCKARPIGTRNTPYNFTFTPFWVDVETFLVQNRACHLQCTFTRSRFGPGADWYNQVKKYLNCFVFLNPSW